MSNHEIIVQRINSLKSFLQQNYAANPNSVPSIDFLKKCYKLLNGISGDTHLTETQKYDLGKCTILYSHFLLTYCDNSDIYTINWYTMREMFQCISDIISSCNMKNDYIVLATETVFGLLLQPWTHSWGCKELLRLYSLIVHGSYKKSRQEALTNIGSMPLYKFFDLLQTCGDYEQQTLILEVIFRLCGKSYFKPETVRELIPESSKLQNLLMDINIPKFDKNVRIFLNEYNLANVNIFSVACHWVLLDDFLFPPSTDALCIWVDCDLKERTLSWSCRPSVLAPPDDPTANSWDHVYVYAANVAKVELTRARREYLQVTLTLNKACVTVRDDTQTKVKAARTLIFYTSDSNKINHLILRIFPELFGKRYLVKAPLQRRRSKSKSCQPVKPSSNIDTYSPTYPVFESITHEIQGVDLPHASMDCPQVLCSPFNPSPVRSKLGVGEHLGAFRQSSSEANDSSYVERIKEPLTCEPVETDDHSVPASLRDPRQSPSEANDSSHVERIKEPLTSEPVEADDHSVPASLISGPRQSSSEANDSSHVELIKEPLVPESDESFPAIQDDDDNISASILHLASEHEDAIVSQTVPNLERLQDTPLSLSLKNQSSFNEDRDNEEVMEMPRKGQKRRQHDTLTHEKIIIKQRKIDSDSSSSPKNPPMSFKKKTYSKKVTTKPRKARTVPYDDASKHIEMMYKAFKQENTNSRGYSGKGCKKTFDNITESFLEDLGPNRESVRQVRQMQMARLLNKEPLSLSPKNPSTFVYKRFKFTWDEFVEAINEEPKVAGTSNKKATQRGRNPNKKGDAGLQNVSTRPSRRKGQSRTRKLYNEGDMSHLPTFTEATVLQDFKMATIPEDDQNLTTKDTGSSGSYHPKIRILSDILLKPASK